MLQVTKWLSRFAVALGGFLIFVGTIVIGLFLIGFFGMVNLSILESENLQSLHISLLSLLGALNQSSS